MTDKEKLNWIEINLSFLNKNYKYTCTELLKEYHEYLSINKIDLSTNPLSNWQSANMGLQLTDWILKIIQG